MIKVKNPNRLNIFDPRAFLTPKRRQMLDAGWPGLFRVHILPSIPVNKVSKDLFDLVQQFKDNPEVAGHMHSYNLLERVLREQCSHPGN